MPFDTGAEGAFLFLPRVGLAFRLNDKTVLRGGYGQSADPRPFQDVRNAYPIANIWSMPAIVFNGATNSFIPVTSLRQGLINTSTPPDVNKGIIPLLANTGQQSGSDRVAVPASLSAFGSSFSTYLVPQSGQGPDQPAG